MLLNGCYYLDVRFYDFLSYRFKFYKFALLSRHANESIYISTIFGFVMFMFRSTYQDEETLTC
jgi:hypothetical protein